MHLSSHGWWESQASWWETLMARPWMFAVTGASTAFLHHQLQVPGERLHEDDPSSTTQRSTIGV